MARSGIRPKHSLTRFQRLGLTRKKRAAGEDEVRRLHAARASPFSLYHEVAAYVQGELRADMSHFDAIW